MASIREDGCMASIREDGCMASIREDGCMASIREDGCHGTQTTRVLFLIIGRARRDGRTFSQGNVWDVQDVCCPCFLEVGKDTLEGLRWGDLVSGLDSPGQRKVI
jgi:hypothetical protein